MPTRRDARTTWIALVLLLTGLVPSPALAEQASSSLKRLPTGSVDTGGYHTCAILDSGLRCWGEGDAGRLGYGSTEDVGENEAPASMRRIKFAKGRTARAISAGTQHTCAILEDGAVTCWGLGEAGRLGYGNGATIGDNERLRKTKTVDLGRKRTARAITAGFAHTCAILDTGQVRCWGEGDDGRLGYGNTADVGDDEKPGSLKPVDLGGNAVAISAGTLHTCAILESGQVRCWGSGAGGKLGHGDTNNIGDTESPGSVAPVDVGAGRTAVAISAGEAHTCALLDNGTVSCWGNGNNGRLGYGDTEDVGDGETPGSVGPVDIGAGRTAVAIAAGGSHSCAVLDTGQVRCWGFAEFGKLGYSNNEDVGDGETPGSVGPVDLGAGNIASGIATGTQHTCAVLATSRIMCWGFGDYGQLGYGNPAEIGDDETPSFAGPVDAGGIVRVELKPRLHLKARPRRDEDRPFRFRVIGQLTGSFIKDEAMCSGEVTITGKEVTPTTLNVDLRGRRCIAAGAVMATRIGGRKLKARFEGNGSLLPAGAEEVVRAG